jgi:fermentation-respiration switch protein FrsA (DUF1100 family)
MHGDSDTIVPIELGEKLHAAAPDPQKVFVTAEKTGHNYPWPPEFTSALDLFFERLSNQPGDGEPARPAAAVTLKPL